MKNAPLTPPHLNAQEIAWLQEATEQARQEWKAVRRKGSHAEKAQALACLSGLVCDLEGPTSALRLSRQAYRLWKLAGDPNTIAVSAAVLAVRLLDAGRGRDALRQSAVALEAMRQLAPQDRPMGLFRCLGKEFLQAGHASEAQAWLELALDTPGADEPADILLLLARALDLEGRLQEAQGRLYEACAAFHHQGDRLTMAQAMLPLARLLLRLGRHWDAASICQEAIPVLERRRNKAAAAEGRDLLRLCLRGNRGLSLPGCNNPFGVVAGVH